MNGTLFSTPLRGVSKFTKLFSATLSSTPLRGKKAQKIISNLLIKNLYGREIISVIFRIEGNHSVAIGHDKIRNHEVGEDLLSE